MEQKVFNLGISRLAGICGICVGLFVLPFAVIDVMIGGLFAPEILYGGSISDWISRIIANPGLAQLGMTLPILGFSAMLIVGICLYQLIQENYWQKQLAIGGYVIGIPIAVSAFAIGSSLLANIDHYSASPESRDVVVSFFMNYFMSVNTIIGPLFIIVIGNSFMAISALKSNTLPKWLCIWAIINGCLISIGFLSVLSPVFLFAEIGGPLTMLWFVTTGVILLKRSFKLQRQ